MGIGKCASLGVKALKKKTWALDIAPFTIWGQLFLALALKGFYKYLGVRSGAEGGDSAHHVHEELCMKLERLQKASAKPQEKLWAVNSILLPQVQYPLANVACPHTQLRRCDRVVRRFVRTALHLPKDTPLGHLHSATVDGELGVPYLATRIPRQREDHLSRLRASADPAIQPAVDTGGKPAADTTTRQRRQHERENWSGQLYDAVDDRRLRGAHLTPHSLRWVDDGHRLM